MSAARIHIQLFGELMVRFEDDAAPPANRFSTQKTAALLATLALSPGKPFPREVLIDRFWADALVEDGRRSLRVALATLRRVLEPTGIPTGTVICATRESVSISADAVTTDVQEFDRAVRRGDTETARQRFAAGELLAAFYDDWILHERERLTDAHEKLTGRGRVAVAEPPPATELPAPLTPAPRDPRERLPHYLTRYIGRETERETFAALLADGTNRLITVTGTGGVGKTRFITQTLEGLPGARTLRYVSLFDATDVAGLSRRVGIALGLEPTNATATAVAITLHSLGRGLLVLDNMEQLLPCGAGDTVATWLAECPHLQIVATSREQLHISGETELPLEPLLVPILPATPERLLDFAAVRLFLDRARLARPDARVTPRNAETVSALCEKLGGLPLALEITASWAGALTFGQMLSRVSAHLLDETGAPTAHIRAARPERHRTVRAAIATSLEPLSPTLSEAFVSLSVFRGGFTKDAANAVLDAERGSAETLTRLRERSLLAVDCDPDAETLRFRQLPAIWEYARERFDAAETSVLCRAHVAHFLAVAETPRTDEAALDADLLNFVAALDFADTLRDDTDLRLCVALQPFWQARGYSREGLERTQRALARHTDSALFRRAMNSAGNLAYDIGAFESSRTHHENALTLAEAAGDTRSIGCSLQGIASCALHADADLPRALALCERAREQFRLLGSVSLEANLVMGMQTLAEMMGDEAQAFRHVREALALSQTAGDKPLEAQALQRLGALLNGYSDAPETRTERLCEAVIVLNAALHLYEGMGNRGGVANVRHELASVAWENGDYDTALSGYEESLTVYKAKGDVWSVAVCLNNLGRLVSEQGKFARAASYMVESLHLRVALGDKHAQLQSIDAVVNLLVAASTQTGKPFGHTLAREAVRLRAADTALRAALGLGAAYPDTDLRAHEEAFATRLDSVSGAGTFTTAQTKGAAWSLTDAIAAARATLAKMR